jgi:hypothetical protein
MLPLEANFLLPARSAYLKVSLTLTLTLSLTPEHNPEPNP